MVRISVADVILENSCFLDGCGVVRWGAGRACPRFDAAGREKGFGAEAGRDQSQGKQAFRANGEKARGEEAPGLCGFATGVALRKAFRLRTGMSMSDWRKHQ